MSRLQNTRGGLRKLWLVCLKHKKLVLMLAFVIIAIVLLIIWVTSSRSSVARAESYKSIRGGAGLEASIDYTCASPCDQKYDFNVYILHENGQQVSVLRPDRNGKIQLAINEGNYIMLVGNRFGKDKIFPQEPLALKNGQLLDLKLRY